MNNDVLVAISWAENLIKSAIENNLLIASPSMIEGEVESDFENVFANYQREMQGYVRTDRPHAVCMAIHRSVWENIGFFPAVPKLLGYEDTLFFHAAKRAKVRTGIVGASWIHHFGSITQNAMKEEQGIRLSQGLGDKNNKKLLNMTFLERKINKFRTLKHRSHCAKLELNQFRRTVHGIRKEGVINWL